MTRLKRGRELNGVLGETARNIFLFGALLSIGLFI
jgi:1,4-dihydroxy-2-naphthoate octaprenyltransferase